MFPGKHFISTVLELLDTKTAMSGSITVRYLMRAAMAGVIVGIFYTVYYAIVAGFDALTVGEGNLHVVGKLIGALVFGWALVFIYYSRSELLTSNMMIVSIGAYHKRTSWPKAMRLLGLCFVGNFLGGALIAMLVWGSSLASGTVLQEMIAAVDHKLAYVSAGPVGGLGRPCPSYGQKGMSEDGAGRNDCLTTVISTDVATYSPGGP